MAAARHHPSKFVLLCLLTFLLIALYTTFLRYCPAGEPPAAQALAILRVQALAMLLPPVLLAHLTYQAAQQAWAAGQPAAATECLSALIARDPWELEAYRQLAEHHARHGHAGLAQRCREQLAAREAELDFSA